MVMLKAVFWKTIRSKEVRPYIWVYYLSLWLWGFYGTFLTAPPTYVRPAMGPVVYDLWVWMCLAGTSTVMLALRMEDLAKAYPSTQRGRRTDIAVRIATGGHACMFFVLLAYEFSAIYAVSLHVASSDEFSIFITSPYVVGCLLLTVQGVVRVLYGDEEDPS